MTALQRRRHRSKRLGALVGVGVLAAVVGAPPAFADDMAVCNGAYQQTQRARLAGKLLEARASAATCLVQSCPRFVRESCAKWHDEIDAEIPSIVTAVVDDDGRDWPDATLQIDEAPAPGALDGTPRPLDVGRHVLVARVAGVGEVTEQVILRVGERERTVRLRLSAPPKTVAAPPEQRPQTVRPVATRVWVIGGVGIALVTAGAITWFSALDSSGSYNDACRAGEAASCSPHEHDRIRRQLAIGEGVTWAGGASLAVAGIMWLTRAHVPVVVEPTRGGISLGVRGSL